MDKAFVRRLVKTLYRPYPECDTSVYKVIPYLNEVYFCWELPHRNIMLNMFASQEIQDPRDIAIYRAWEDMRLEHFGFMKDENGNWKENPFYDHDQCITGKKETQVTVQ